MSVEIHILDEAGYLVAYAYKTSDPRAFAYVWEMEQGVEPHWVEDGYDTQERPKWAAQAEHLMDKLIARTSLFKGSRAGEAKVGKGVMATRSGFYADSSGRQYRKDYSKADWHIIVEFYNKNNQMVPEEKFDGVGEILIFADPPDLYDSTTNLNKALRKGYPKAKIRFPELG